MVRARPLRRAVWTDCKIAQLRMLWPQGHSTAEIGRRIAVTKNAVVGKAHRLGLPSRPSPLKVDRSVLAAARAYLQAWDETGRVSDEELKTFLAVLRTAVTKAKAT